MKRSHRLTAARTAGTAETVAGMAVGADGRKEDDIMQILRSARTAALTGGILVSLTLAGCRTRRPAAPADPITVKLLIDLSVGAPALPQLVRDTTTAVGEVVTVPGSVVEVWPMGVSAGETVCAARIRYEGTTRRGAAATGAARRRFLAELTAAVPDLVERERSAITAPRSTSPLAESVTKMLGSDLRPGEHVLVLILSDLREVTKGAAASPAADWECGRIPTPDAFRRYADARGALPAGLLESALVRVVALGVDADAVPGGRCEWSLVRQRALSEAWRAAFSEMGAASFSVVRDPTTLARVLRTEGGQAE